MNKILLAITMSLFVAQTFAQEVEAPPKSRGECRQLLQSIGEWESVHIADFTKFMNSNDHAVGRYVNMRLRNDEVVVGRIIDTTNKQGIARYEQEFTLDTKSGSRTVKLKDIETMEILSLNHVPLSEGTVVLFKATAASFDYENVDLEAIKKLKLSFDPSRSNIWGDFIIYADESRLVVRIGLDAFEDRFLDARVKATVGPSGAITYSISDATRNLELVVQYGRATLYTTEVNFWGRKTKKRVLTLRDWFVQESTKYYGPIDSFYK